MGKILDLNGETASDLNGKAPWYVTAIYKLGVPVATMAVLLWFLLGVVNGKIGEIEQTLLSHTREQDEIRFYLRSICTNIAEAAGKSAASCFPPPEASR